MIHKIRDRTAVINNWIAANIWYSYFWFLERRTSGKDIVPGKLGGGRKRESYDIRYWFRDLPGCYDSLRDLKKSMYQPG